MPKIKQELIDHVADALEVAGLEMSATPNKFLILRDKTAHLAKAAIQAYNEYSDNGEKK